MYTITIHEDGPVIHKNEVPFTPDEIYEILREEPDGLYDVNAPYWRFPVAVWEGQVCIVAEKDKEDTLPILKEQLNYQQK